MLAKTIPTTKPPRPSRADSTHQTLISAAQVWPPHRELAVTHSLTVSTGALLLHGGPFFQSSTALLQTPSSGCQPERENPLQRLKEPGFLNQHSKDRPLDRDQTNTNPKD